MKVTARMTLLVAAMSMAGCTGNPQAPDAQEPASVRRSCVACEQIGTLGGTAPPIALRDSPHEHVIQFNHPTELDLTAHWVRLGWKGADASAGAVLSIGSKVYNAPGELSADPADRAWSELNKDLVRFEEGEREPLRLYLAAEADVPPSVVWQCYRVIQGAIDTPTSNSSWDVAPKAYEEALEADMDPADPATGPVIVVEEEDE